MVEELVVTVTDKETFGRFKSVRELVERTNKENPKPADLEELRRVLAEHPRLWKFAGDVAKRATHHLICTYSGSSKFVQESQERAAEVMREEYGYKTASPMERMLIEQVVICWLRLGVVERLHTIKTYESHSSEHGLYWERRLTGAQHRFTRAVETLARVRKHMAAAELLASRTPAPRADLPAVPLLKAVGS